MFLTPSVFFGGQSVRWPPIRPIRPIRLIRLICPICLICLICPICPTRLICPIRRPKSLMLQFDSIKISDYLTIRYFPLAAFTKVIYPPLAAKTPGFIGTYRNNLSLHALPES
ncbi:MAG: hypothetical protein RJB11_3 [Planctomycetota bacterium]